MTKLNIFSKVWIVRKAKKLTQTINHIVVQLYYYFAPNQRLLNIEPMDII